jgi:uncharacterized protein (TIGR02147 family)
MQRVYSYMDFRLLLQDYYEQNKSARAFTWREFSKAAGYSSPVFLKLVCEGKANLSAVGVERVADAIGLAGKEKTYFRLLVLLGQEKQASVKRGIVKELRELSQSEGVQVIQEDQYDYYDEWYHGAIRELLTQVPDQSDYKAIGQKLTPSVSAKQVKKSVELLHRLQLITLENGKWVQTNAKISTGNDFVSLAVKKLHGQMAGLAQESIEAIPRDQRDISGLTVGISTRGFNALQHEIAEFRRKVAEIVSQDEIADSVYRINVQLFPLTKVESKVESTVQSIAAHAVPNALPKGANA